MMISTGEGGTTIGFLSDRSPRQFTGSQFNTHGLPRTLKSIDMIPNHAVLS
jgi:hypothetical protein